MDIDLSVEYEIALLAMSVHPSNNSFPLALFQI